MALANIGEGSQTSATYLAPAGTARLNCIPIAGESRESSQVTRLILVGGDKSSGKPPGAPVTHENTAGIPHKSIGSAETGALRGCYAVVTEGSARRVGKRTRWCIWG